MRPDRLVVGECRGAEVVDLLAALNTGHDGGAGTLHANAPADVPARLEALGLLGGLPRAGAARPGRRRAAGAAPGAARRPPGGVLESVCLLLPQGPDRLVTVVPAWVRGRGARAGGDRALIRLLDQRDVAGAATSCRVSPPRPGPPTPGHRPQPRVAGARSPRRSVRQPAPGHLAERRAGAAARPARGAGAVGAPGPRRDAGDRAAGARRPAWRSRRWPSAGRAGYRAPAAACWCAPAGPRPRSPAGGRRAPTVAAAAPAASQRRARRPAVPALGRRSCSAGLVAGGRRGGLRRAGRAGAAQPPGAPAGSATAAAGSWTSSAPSPRTCGPACPAPAAARGIGPVRGRRPADRLAGLTRSAVRLADRTGAPLAELLERIEADARAADRGAGRRQRPRRPGPGPPPGCWPRCRSAASLSATASASTRWRCCCTPRRRRLRRRRGRSCNSPGCSGRNGSAPRRAWAG